MMPNIEAREATLDILRHAVSLEDIHLAEQAIDALRAVKRAELRLERLASRVSRGWEVSK
jgi:hypothetical protein